MSIIERLKSLLGGAPPRDGNGAAADTDTGDMISCQEALSVIQEFIDGELEDASYERVKAHFDVCRRCYPYLRLEEAFREALRRAGMQARAPEALKERLARALTESEPED